MKRTHILLVPDDKYPGFRVDRKITCQVTGEMADGTKVWTEVDTDGNDQYQLYGFKIRNKRSYYFAHI